MTIKPWTPREIDFLRRHVGSMPHTEIARALGRSRSAVQTKAKRVSATTREHWSDADIATLARLYPTSTAAEIARRLGRTTKAIHEAAKSRGLTKQSRSVTGDAFRAEVRRLNAEGYPDGEIAAVLGCERHTVSKHRRALGLPSMARGERYRRRVAERTRAQCEAAGVDSLGAIRALAFRDFAAGRGWPSDLPPRAVMILDALSTGPMTRRQIADAIGMPWKGSRLSLKSNGPGGSYLAGLMRRGLVVPLGRLVTGRGKGRSVNLYSLALTAERSMP